MDCQSMDDLLRVFVYGSLMRGGEYHHLMLESGGRFLGEGRLQTPYPLVQADYPRLLDKPGQGDRVKGELYSLPGTDSWTILDALEGHPVEYCRRVEQVEWKTQAIPAWTYFYVMEDADRQAPSHKTM